MIYADYLNRKANFLIKRPSQSDKQDSRNEKKNVSHFKLDLTIKKNHHKRNKRVSGNQRNGNQRKSLMSRLSIVCGAMCPKSRRMKEKFKNLQNRKVVKVVLLCERGRGKSNKEEENNQIVHLNMSFSHSWTIEWCLQWRRKKSKKGRHHLDESNQADGGRDHEKDAFNSNMEKIKMPRLRNQPTEHEIQCVCVFEKLNRSQNCNHSLRKSKWGLSKSMHVMHPFAPRKEFQLS